MTATNSKNLVVVNPRNSDADNTHVEPVTVLIDDMPSFESCQEVILNTVDDLAQGKVHTTGGKTEFTILVVGETGTGKTTILSLLANILKGSGPETYKKFHEPSNEAGGSAKHSQTNTAKVYEFVSRNGVTIRILDAPGLADTRGIAQDELHKQSIAQAIQEHITSVSAVLILANGTVPRLGVATDYALSTLSSMFPVSLAKNISFIFTNVSSPLSWNFDDASLPYVLRNNNQYLLDNPVAMQDKLVREHDKMKSRGKINLQLLQAFKQSVADGHMKALQTLVQMFDWFDTLQPQPTKDILSLYQQSQGIEKQISDALASMKQITDKKQALIKIQVQSEGTKLTMELYKRYESVITQRVNKFVDTKQHNTLCDYPGCYSNCHIECALNFSVNPDNLATCVAFGVSRRLPNCSRQNCGHPIAHHRHYNSVWKLVEDKQVTVDTVAKKKYENAKEESEREELRMEELNKMVDQLGEGLAEATAKVGELTRSYAKLSLSGSFTGQVKKSVQMLELNVETMRSNGTDEDTIRTVQKSLDNMKAKLKLVEDANALAQKKLTKQSFLKRAFNTLTGK